MSRSIVAPVSFALFGIASIVAYLVGMLIAGLLW